MNSAVNEILVEAIAHHHAGRLAEAEDRYRQVLNQQPDHAVALQNLGLIAHAVGQYPLAVDLIRQAISIDSRNAAMLSNLGISLKAMGQLDEAVDCYRQAIKFNPLDYFAHSNLGNLLREQGHYEAAVGALKTSVQINPQYAVGYNNLGGALSEIGDVTGAVSAYRRAIELQSDLAGAHFNLALVLLQLGEPSAFEEYEWRWKFDGFSSPRRNFKQPLWKGEPLNGRKILLHAEQGLGDTIQFIRYARKVAQLGGKVIVECQPELEQLIGQIPGIQRVIAAGEALPPFDTHCPLLSLPLACKRFLNQVPYISVPKNLSAKWAGPLSEIRGLKVGIAWAGSSAQRDDKKRSLRLDQFAPLAGLTGIQFYSLQKGSAAQQIQNAPPGLEIIDLSDHLTDMAETAALIMHLDLVISVDTSVAHLAGAMGKPLWVLLAFAPSWQWMLDRNDSPWYPTAELFRQPAIGDWSTVIHRVQERLEQELLSQRGD